MRQFIARDGTRWDLYEVSRESLVAGFPNVLPPAYRDGWLVFESAGERRRLAPFPGEWASFSSHALRLLLDRAERVEHRDSRPRVRMLGRASEGPKLT